MLNYGNYYEAPVEIDDEYDYWFQQVSDEAYDKFKKHGIEDNKIIVALAEQRLEEEEPGWSFFDDNKLSICHAYAILGRFNEFKDEFNFPEPDLDIDHE